MHITLHLTTNCNLDCKYCYSTPADKANEMPKEIIDKSIEFSIQEFDTNIGIIFFGGEPLMKKELIRYAVGRCRNIEKARKYKFHFHFKVTTNGLLIDEDFLKFSRDSGLSIGLSIDGIQRAHDKNRIFKNGQGSFEQLNQKIDKLLEYQPYANALMVVSPENVEFYARSVEFLVKRGFRYIIASLNYAGNWDEKHLDELKCQYEEISKLYLKWTAEERKFYFSPFEMKLATHIRGNDDHTYACQLSKKQISISPDGFIYPCVQFVKDGESNKSYSIGNVWNGFNVNREKLFQKSIEEKASCNGCTLKHRCYNTCSCLNWQTTGYINTVSPLLCETERILVSIADKLGRELYKRRLPMFIQKHYNISYPLLSMLEDESRPKKWF